MPPDNNPMNSEGVQFSNEHHLHPLPNNVSWYVHDVVATAKRMVLRMRRYPSWLLNLGLGPVLMIFPFIFLGDTLVGKGRPLSGSAFGEYDYTGYVGYLAVPLIAVALSNTVFTWLGGLLRMERRSGTLERVLVSAQFPSALFLGTAFGHLFYMGLFVAATVLLLQLWIPLDFNINYPSAVAALFLHLAVTYGLAFALSSALLRIADSWAVQLVISKGVLALLSGATFPISIYPEWLQAIARMVPFTWAFDLERRSLLRAEQFGEMAPDLAVLAGMTVFCWIVGFILLGRELNAARRSGVLGSF